MDPLSIAASVTGLATAAGEVAKILKPYISAMSESVPQIALRVHAEVESTRIVLSAVQRLVNNLGLAKNTYLVHIDHVVAVFSEGVLVFSELEHIVGDLRLEIPSISIPVRSRLIWAHKEGTLGSLVSRLQGFKSSMSLLLALLNCDSNQQAEQHQLELTGNINRLLESNQILLRRLSSLETVIDARSLPSDINDITLSEDALSPVSENTTVIPNTSFFDFETDLGSSRVYRRVKRESMDYSFRSSMASSNIGSMLSGFSLGEVSNISIIALPIYAEDLTNSRHYSFGNNPVLDTAGIPVAERPQIHPSMSLFHESMWIKQMLLQIPQFTEWFKEVQELYQNESPNPVRDLKHVCQKGKPLLALINRLQPHVNLGRYSDSLKHRQVAIYEFIQACNIWGLASVNHFTLADLTGEGYVGFLKVLETLKSVLTELLQQGLLDDDIPRDSIFPLNHSYSSEELTSTINRFLDTERAFIEEMKTLLDIEHSFRQGTLTGDQCHSVFGPLDSILDHQVGLLLALEAEALRAPSEQSWGIPFTCCLSDCGVFMVYVSLSSERNAVLRSQIAANTSNSINLSKLEACARLLTLPILRLEEYEKFIESLIQLEPHALLPGDDKLEELMSARHVIRTTLNGILDAKNKLELEKDFEDLKNRIEDWKGHSFKGFGDLIQCGRFPITIDEAKGSRIFRVYLFERMLLACKEAKPSRKRKYRGVLALEANGTKPLPILVMKGRIYMHEILEVENRDSRDSYLCSIKWRGRESGGILDILFSDATQRSLWADMIRSGSAQQVSSPSRGIRNGIVDFNRLNLPDS